MTTECLRKHQYFLARFFFFFSFFKIKCNQNRERIFILPLEGFFFFFYYSFSEKWELQLACEQIKNPRVSYLSSLYSAVEYTYILKALSTYNLRVTLWGVLLGIITIMLLTFIILQLSRKYLNALNKRQTDTLGFIVFMY